MTGQKERQFRESIWRVGRQKSLRPSLKVYTVVTILLAFAYPDQELFTHMETSSLPLKGCKIEAYAQLPRLGAGRDLYRVTPAMTRGLGFSGLLEGPFHLIALTTYKGMWRTYSNLDPHGSTILLVCISSYDNE
jgi:hypothetical protein